MAILEVIRKTVAGRTLYYVRDEEKAQAYRLLTNKKAIGVLGRERMETLGVKLKVFRENKSSLIRMKEDDTGAREREKRLDQDQEKQDIVYREKAERERYNDNEI